MLKYASAKHRRSNSTWSFLGTKTDNNNARTERWPVDLFAHTCYLTHCMNEVVFSVFTKLGLLLICSYHLCSTVDLCARFLQLQRSGKEFLRHTTDSSSEFIWTSWSHEQVFPLYISTMHLSIYWVLTKTFSYVYLVLYRDEIQRIKASNPDITHREAFSAAAKNV